MPKLKVLSGAEVIKILNVFGFEIQNQKGSHVKLKKFSEHKEKQTLIIPNHSEIDIGTLKSIYRQAIKYVPEEKLHKHFYTD